jgi:tetratricopeptide (TPR) repeat protein
MKQVIPFAVLVALMAVLNLFPGVSLRSSNLLALEAIALKKAGAVSCVPDRSLLQQANPADMIPLPGWGTYRWATRNGNDSAEYYFNQGINMYYSFHIVEAMASFQKAVYLDPTDPMPQWGIALAYGPNINDVAYNYSPLALEAARKADALSASASGFEKALISAMLQRYSDDPKKTREVLDNAYATTMREIYRQFPAQADAGALFADALMIQHPWDLYEQDQQPKAWTPELVAVLEQVLRLAPDHPGANHYYIHAVEASKNPGRALPSAAKLGGLLPMVSHMVHMPSHIYIRTGMYDKGVAVNKQAINGYEAYKKLLPSVENGSFLYLLHNLHMQAASAMNNGDYREAMFAADELARNIPMAYMGGAPPEAEYLQYMYMSRMFTDLRFGKWPSLIAGANLPDSFVYARILQAFSKSIAHSRNQSFGLATSEIRDLERLLLRTDRLKKKMGAFNAAFAGGEVALAMAKGILAEAQHRLVEAIAYMEQAVQLEDRMIYNEPKDWILPPRQYFGAVLLKAGENQRAETVFREDLAFNPGNGWSLRGLELSLRAQGKANEAKEVADLLKQTESNRDFNPAGPVF